MDEDLFKRNLKDVDDFASDNVYVWLMDVVDHGLSNDLFSNAQKAAIILLMVFKGWPFFDTRNGILHSVWVYKKPCEILYHAVSYVSCNFNH